METHTPNQCFLTYIYGDVNERQGLLTYIFGKYKKQHDFKRTSMCRVITIVTMDKIVKDRASDDQRGLVCLTC